MNALFVHRSILLSVHFRPTAASVPVRCASRATMAGNLHPPEAINTAIKRARSAEQSKTGTPTLERSFDFEHANLPHFLRLKHDELEAKFEEIDAKQRERLDHLRKTNDPDSPWTQFASNTARLRNRYSDIKPWDKTRVKLKILEGSSDYINASPILLQCSKTGQERKYIATQGPKETSVGHFWQMIWNETGDVAVVIMLTQLQEGVREKCFQYFPEDAETPPFEFKVIDEAGEEQPATLTFKESRFDESSKTTIRTLKIESQEQSKLVHHLFFLGWPDYGVPDTNDRHALLELIKLSREMNGGWENPRVVHCSAGVGRTGSFIALEHLLAELDVGRMDDMKSDEDDPIFETVDALRQQRMTMVQSEAQFQLLYELVRDATYARIKEQAIAEKMKGMTTGQSSLTTGEPVHKAMRLTRAMRNVWSGFRERSASRKEEKKRNAETTPENHLEAPGSEVPEPKSSPQENDPAVLEPGNHDDSPQPASKEESSTDESAASTNAATPMETDGIPGDKADSAAEHDGSPPTETFHDAEESPEGSQPPAADIPNIQVSSEAS